MSKEEQLRLTYYPEAAFGGYSDTDGAIRFHARVNALLTPSAVVLDIGCGRGACADDTVSFRRNLRNLRGKCKRVIGIDVDEAGRENAFLDEFRLIGGDRWPVEDETIDLCVSDYVLEHVRNPQAFFSECARVLKPRGSICVRTPNKYSYVALISRCIPNAWHAWVLKTIGKKRGADDVFPTLYRCNTARKLRRMMRIYGFEPCVYAYDDEPSYLVFSRTAYALGVIAHRFIPPMCKVNLYAFGRKAA
ncbi:MAG: class I SAM-dependent methyltransferase [Planctomycetota bacterium]